jgi:hypothetical protein
MAIIPEESVDANEVASLIREAAVARNGWKVILARCAIKATTIVKRPYSLGTLNISSGQGANP